MHRQEVRHAGWLFSVSLATWSCRSDFIASQSQETPSSCPWLLALTCPALAVHDVLCVWKSSEHIVPTMAGTKDRDKRPALPQGIPWEPHWEASVSAFMNLAFTGLDHSLPCILYWRCVFHISWIFLIQFFSNDIFWSHIFPSYNSSKILPLPNSCSIFLSLSQANPRMKINQTNKINQTTTKAKTNKNLQKIKHELVLCWPITFGNGDHHGVWLIRTVALHWRKLIFPFQEVSIVSGFLLGGGSPCLLSLLSAGTLSGFNQGDPMPAVTVSVS